MRNTLWGCNAASLIVSTGAKQTSEPSITADHSSRVLRRTRAASRSFISGQRAYEVNTRVIKAADEMLGQTANLR